MSIRSQWISSTHETRFYIVIVAIFGAVTAAVSIGSAIDEYHFNQLPATEQRRIQEEKRRESTERARLLDEKTRLAREISQEHADRVARERSSLERHKDNVRSCVEVATRLLPGFWPSGEAVSRIEADCAERESHSP